MTVFAFAQSVVQVQTARAPNGLFWGNICSEGLIRRGIRI